MSGIAWAEIAAVLTGLAGVLTAWAALVKARHEGHEHCDDQLDAARAEAEQYAAEVHRLRMERGAASLWLLLAVVCFLACAALTATAVGLNVDGKRGPAGPTGPAGSDGQSVVGPPGRDGRDGVSIVGPSGETIVGPPGASGTRGADGASVSGPQGSPGQAGSPGSPGSPGSDGVAGQSIVGPQGLQGPIGPQGQEGQRGERGMPGPTCPAGFKEQTVTLTVKVAGRPTDISALVCALD